MFGSQRWWRHRPLLLLSSMLVWSLFGLTLGLVTGLPEWVVIRDGELCHGTVQEVLDDSNRGNVPSVVFVQFDSGCSLSNAPVNVIAADREASDWYPGFEADFFVNPVEGWRGGVVPTAVLPEDTWGGILLFSVTTTVLILVFMARLLLVLVRRRATGGSKAEAQPLD